MIRARLEALAAERDELLIRLDVLRRASLTRSDVPPPKPAVANTSPAMDKVALFRRLFGGRTDVFPVRWENPKTGKSGYAPACANEWVRGVCGTNASLRGGELEPSVARAAFTSATG